MDSANRTVNLTCRGKRKRRDAPPAAATASSKPRPRGRPLKTASELRAAKKSRTAHLTSLPITPKMASKSWLERLPAELIEQIFLHALEVNMAKASPFLGRILAKESIYRTLILFAFFEDDELHPVETKLFAPATYRVLSSEERLRVQRGVLDSKWCNVTRIEQCFPILTRLATLQEWHKVRPLLIKQVKENLGNRQNTETQKSHQPASLSEFDESAVFADFCKAIDADGLTNNNRISHRISQSDTVRWTFNVRYFPTRLLSPSSWYSTNRDDNPLVLLHLLQDGCILRKDERYFPGMADVSAINHGMETAIQEHDFPALHLLLVIHDLVLGYMHQHSGFGAMVSRQLPLTFERLTELLHLATLQAEESSSLIATLLDKYQGDLVPKDDEVLIKWAIKQLREDEMNGEEADPCAKWMLEGGPGKWPY